MKSARRHSITAIGKARELPDIRQRMTHLGFTPEEFGEFVKRDLARWHKAVQETGVKVE